MNDLLDRRYEICADIMKKYIAQMNERAPLDNFLKKIFASDGRYGSRDRQFIRNALFNTMRCSLWLKKAGMKIDDQKSIEIAAECSLLPSQFEKITGTSVTYSDSMPDFLTCKSEKSAREFMQPALLWIRTNIYFAQGLDFTVSPLLPDCRVVSDKIRSRVRETEQYKNGFFEIQDISSQCVCLAANPIPGEHWCDFCAGGGGKTMHLAKLLNYQGFVTASDIRMDKFQEIHDRAKRNGFSDLIETKTQRETLNKKFDGVLVDAPCSSSGRLKRDPDLRLRISEQLIKYYAQIQKDILDLAAKTVKTGGQLVYATCSIAKQENEEQILKFLERHKEFKLEQFKHPITQQIMNGAMLISPCHGGDGMFMAKLRKM